MSKLFYSGNLQLLRRIAESAGMRGINLLVIDDDDSTIFYPCTSFDHLQSLTLQIMSMQKSAMKTLSG